MTFFELQTYIEGMADQFRKSIVDAFSELSDRDEGVVTEERKRFDAALQDIWDSVSLAADSEYEKGWAVGRLAACNELREALGLETQPKPSPEEVIQEAHAAHRSCNRGVPHMASAIATALRDAGYLREPES